MAFAAGVHLDSRRALTDRGTGANTRSVAKDGEEQNHAPSDAMEGGSHAGTLSLRLDFLGSQAKDSILVGEHSAQLRVRSYHSRRSVVHLLSTKFGVFNGLRSTSGRPLFLAPARGRLRIL